MKFYEEGEKILEKYRGFQKIIKRLLLGFIEMLKQRKK